MLYQRLGSAAARTGRGVFWSGGQAHSWWVVTKTGGADLGAAVRIDLTGVFGLPAGGVAARAERDSRHERIFYAPADPRAAIQINRAIRIGGPAGGWPAQTDFTDARAALGWTRTPGAGRPTGDRRDWWRRRRGRRGRRGRWDQWDYCRRSTATAVTDASAALRGIAALDAVRAAGAFLLAFGSDDVIAVAALPARLVVLLGAAALSRREAILRLDLLPGPGVVSQPYRRQHRRAE